MSSGEILVPIFFFLTVFGLFFIYIRARNKERLTLIEKGADASIFMTSGGNKNQTHSLLKIGLFFIGIAVGLIAGFFVQSMGMVCAVAYISMIFLFGGLGLLVYYPISKRMG